MSRSVEVDCAIAGGGPAGVMLGYLLARAGVRALVLEKHADFLRDFRGDTIHPSTLEVMAELGLLDELLRLPHQEVQEITGVVEGQEVVVADFRHLPTRCGFVAFMPQWDFLNFMVEHGRRYRGFGLEMEAEVTGLIVEGGVVRGLRAHTPAGSLEVRAALTVGADGRTSTVRAEAGLPVRNLGANIDVLWMRLPRHDSDPQRPLGHFRRGRVLVMLNRGDYWQCGFVIAKGGRAELERGGIAAFRAELERIAPFLAGRADVLADWSTVRTLEVAVDRLTRWSRPGLLCIGDSAHAMSPIGGVGINLAIQDAVATARLLARPLRAGELSSRHLVRVQQRREPAARWTQMLQVAIQQRILGRVLEGAGPLAMPLPLRLLRWFPVLRRLPARVLGLGFRPEHVEDLEQVETLKPAPWIPG